MKEIIIYKMENGKCPFDIWLNKLDKSVRVRIFKRIERIAEGNFGDYKKIDSEISEIRFSIGKGYRIYFSELNEIIIIFLCAGDKSAQQEDILLAKKYLHNLRERSEQWT